MFDYQTKGFSSYGASMGRQSTLAKDIASALILRQVPIDNQGYDPGGAYWGGPSDLYYVEDTESGEVAYLRAKGPSSVKAAFPNATWVDVSLDGDLDDMVSGYIACALWSSNDESDDCGGNTLDDNYTADDISDVSLLTIISECGQFLKANAADIGSNLSQAGHDFWLTRNGHGAGFWGGDWAKDVGERLTAACNAFREVNLVVGDDGKIYQE